MSTYLVFGATGQTGRHFTARALADGHTVRALARNPAKFGPQPHLEIVTGSITESPDLDRLVDGADFVVSLLGDAEMQRTGKSTRNSSATSCRR